MIYRFTKENLVLSEVVGGHSPNFVITRDLHTIPLDELAEALAPFLAPPGDTAQTAEPTEEEWFTAWRSIPYGEISLPRWPHLLCRTVSIEAHRLAALRVKGGTNG